MSMSIKVRLIDLVKRITKYDKKIGVILNGEDNAYPERVERFINNSVTAKMASRLMATYISGKGFDEEANKVIVNKTNDTTLMKVTYKTSKSVSKHRGIFLHVDWNANFDISSFDMLPYSHCRLGEKDDLNYNGKILVYNNWDGSMGKFDSKKVDVVDVYNERKEVIQSQVNRVKGDTDLDKWRNYKGQILYVNFDEEYDYPLSTIDAVMHDCDSEGQASVFKNRSLRKGFFGKTVMMTKPMIRKFSSYKDPKDFYNDKSQRDKFKNTMEEFVGAENNGGLLHVELEHDGEKFDEAVKFENIPSDIDDKMFEYTENSVFKNILVAFNNLPSGLIRSDNTLFGNSGALLKEMKKSYQENTSQEREELEEIIMHLYEKLAVKDKPAITGIIPLIDAEEEVVEEEPEVLNLVLRKQKIEQNGTIHK